MSDLFKWLTTEYSLNIISRTNLAFSNLVIFFFQINVLHVLLCTICKNHPISKMFSYNLTHFLTRASNKSQQIIIFDALQWLEIYDFDTYYLLTTRVIYRWEFGPKIFLMFKSHLWVKLTTIKKMKTWNKNYKSSNNISVLL